MQTSSHEAAVLAAVHGGGLACLARFRADQETGLTRLATSLPVPGAGIWLLVHRDNRQTPRIRVALTSITECVRRHLDVLNPPDVADVSADAPTDDGNPRAALLSASQWSDVDARLRASACAGRGCRR
jgi:hypothetical protein